MSVLCADGRTVLVRERVRVTRYTVLADGQTLLIEQLDAARVVDVGEQRERALAHVAKLNEASNRLEREHGVRVPVSVRVG